MLSESHKQEGKDRHLIKDQLKKHLHMVFKIMEFFLFV